MSTANDAMALAMAQAEIERLRNELADVTDTLKAMVIANGGSFRIAALDELRASDFALRIERLLPVPDHPHDVLEIRTILKDVNSDV